MLLVGVFALWVQRQALDTDNWTNTSSALLADPKVDQAVGDYLVRELFSSVDVAGEIRGLLPAQAAGLAGPAAAGLQQLAGQLAPKVLARPAVQDAWRGANRVAHRELLRILDGGGKTVSTRGGVVALNLYPLVNELATTIGVQSQVAGLQSKLQGAAGAQIQTAAQHRLGITVPVQSGQIVIMRSGQLRMAQDIAVAVRGLAAVLMLGAFALFALTVWVARGWRRLVLRRVGWCFIAVGLGVLIARRLLEPRVIDALVPAPSIRPAADAAWMIGTSLLRDMARALAAYGAVIIATAWLAGSTRPARALRELIAFDLRERPGFAYGTLGVALLLVMLWGPTPALRQPIPMLGIAALLGVGVQVIRRQTAREFPHAGAHDARRILSHWSAPLRRSRADAPSDGTERPAESTSDDLVLSAQDHHAR